MFLKRTLATSLSFLLVTQSLCAWNAAGHMIIAALAYHEMQPTVRDRVAELLKHHPNFKSWQTAYDEGPKNIPFDAYVLMRASFWPDEIRRKGNPHDHPTWHYINYPLKPPEFPMDPPLPQNENVLTAIEKCRAILRDSNSSAESRAIHLAWLLHMIGDIHQPLHAVALVNDMYPNGDKGGNDFWIIANKAPINLHSFWDGLLGSTRNMKSLYDQGTRLRGAISFNSTEQAVTSTDWALESRHAAIEHAYLRGKLKGGTSKETAERLPSDYPKQAKAAGERRAALAAHRLAVELNATLLR